MTASQCKVWGAPLTLAMVEQNYVNVAKICSADVEALSTDLANGCYLKAQGGAIVCGVAGGAGFGIVVAPSGSNPNATTPADTLTITAAGMTISGGAKSLAFAVESAAAAGTPSLRRLGSGATDAMAGNDSRASDSRIPTGACGGDLAGSFPNCTVVDDSHAHTAATLPAASTAGSGLVEFATDGEVSALLAPQANDSRLSNPRDPNAHGASHRAGGTDEVATTTPAAGAIPKAGGAGTLGAGWISALPYLADSTTYAGSASQGGPASAVANDSVALGVKTTGNFMADLAAGSGIAVTHTPAEGSTATVALDYSATLGGNPGLAAGASQFGATGLLFEGATADAIETLLTAVDPTASDKTITLPNASGTVAVAATSPVTLSAAGSIGLTQNAGTDVTADLEEETHATEHQDGGADEIAVTGGMMAADFGDFTCDGTATGCAVDPNAITLGIDTTGNYAAGDAEAGNSTGVACTDCVTLGTETSGNYVASLMAGAGLAGDASGEGSAPTMMTASQEVGFLADGGSTSLTCGAAAGGKAQVLDSGAIEYCDGAPTSNLRTGFLDADGSDANSGGTVTSVSGSVASGVTVGVATGTTTPVITVSLGSIAPLVITLPNGTDAAPSLVIGGGSLHDDNGSGQLAYSLSSTTYWDFTPSIGFRTYSSGGGGGYVCSFAGSACNFGSPPGGGNRLNFGGGNGLSIYGEGSGGAENFVGIIQGDFSGISRGFRWYQATQVTTAGSGSPLVLVATDTSKVIHNEGATAQTYVTLPSAAAGLSVTLIVSDADGLRVTAAAGDVIHVGGLGALGVDMPSSAGGECHSTTIANSITLNAVNATDWFSTSVVGLGWTCS